MERVKSQGIVLLVLEMAVGVLTSLILGLLFAKWSTKLAEGDMWIYDQVISRAIYSFRTPPLTSMMIFVTGLGAGFTLKVMSVATIFFAWKRHRKEALLFIIVLLMGLAINIGLKNIAKRPRPEIAPLVAETSYSYPSGHAMNSMVFYSMVAFFVYHFTRSKKWSLVFYAMSCGLIGLIGFSRVYLGVHYPSDVVAGWVIGGWWLAMALAMEKTMVFWRLMKRGGKGVRRYD